MPKKCCQRRIESDSDFRSCEMGSLGRFCEPIALLALSRLGEAHGYQILQEAESLAVTPANLDSAAVYRVLRRLEDFGFVSSVWNTEGSGPARRVYQLTPPGREHLEKWAASLEAYAAAVAGLAKDCREETERRIEIPTADAR